MKYAILLSFLAGSAQAASYNSSGSGPWNAAATWGGGGYPSTNDTWTIKPDHVITLPYGYSVTCGSGVFATATAGHQGKLIIQGALTLGASVFMGVTTNASYSEIDMSSGAVLNLNGFNIGANKNGTSYNYFHFTGNGEGRWTVNGPGWFALLGSGGFAYADISFSSGDFVDLGSRSFNYYAASGADFKIDSVTYSNCGRLYFPNMATSYAANIYMNGVDIRNSTDTIVIEALGGAAYMGPTAGGKFGLYNVTIDSATGYQQVQLDAGNLNFNISSSVFRNIGLAVAAGPNYSPTITNTFWVSTITVGGTFPFTNTAGTVTFNSNYFYAESDNPHFFQFAAASTHTIQNNVIENNAQGAGTDDGDIYMMPVSAVAFSSGVISNNLILGTSEHSVMLSGQGWSGLLDYTTITHNTHFFNPAYSKTKNCNRIGETYTTGKTAMLASITNTLCVSSGTSFGFFLSTANAAVVIDAITTMNYNGYWNLGNPRYQNTKTVGAYGANDVQANPLFVDSRRNLATWDTYAGGNGSSGDAIANLMNINKTNGSHNSKYSIGSLMSWVQAGFIPQNAAFRKTASDGGDIGAFPVQQLMEGFFFSVSP